MNKLLNQEVTISTQHSVPSTTRAKRPSITIDYTAMRLLLCEHARYTGKNHYAQVPTYEMEGGNRYSVSLTGTTKTFFHLVVERNVVAAEMAEVDARREKTEEARYRCERALAAVKTIVIDVPVNLDCIFNVVPDFDVELDAA